MFVQTSSHGYEMSLPGSQAKGGHCTNWDWGQGRSVPLWWGPRYHCNGNWGHSRDRQIDMTENITFLQLFKKVFRGHKFFCGATDLLAASMAAKLFSTTYLRACIGGARNGDFTGGSHKNKKNTKFNDLGYSLQLKRASMSPPRSRPTLCHGFEYMPKN